MAEEQQEAMSPEEAAAVAAMEAAAAPDAGGATGAGGKALSQNEIDNLLGFGGDGGDNKTGIKALLDKALLSYERLPMLEVVFDRFVRNLSSTLRNFTSDNVDVSIDAITSMRFEDYLNSIPLPALITVFQAVEWENYGLINVDSSLTFSLVDVLLGGARANRPLRVEGRPYTTIEQDIVKTVVNAILDDMCAAFNPLTPATFRFERMESNPRFCTITRPANAVILISLRIDMDERGGKAEILFPYATLEPIKNLLTQMFTGEKFGKDNAWEDHFSNELNRSMLQMEAILEGKMIKVKELAELKVGSTLVLDHTANDPVVLRCNGQKLMLGKLGASANKVAVRVDQLLNTKLREIL
jgi:flagellar motor switch protein FliM